jgi:hypothetical protein
MNGKMLDEFKFFANIFLLKPLFASTTKFVALKKI